MKITQTLGLGRRTSKTSRIKTSLVTGLIGTITIAQNIAVKCQLKLTGFLPYILPPFSPCPWESTHLWEYLSPVTREGQLASWGRRKHHLCREWTQTNCAPQASIRSTSGAKSFSKVSAAGDAFCCRDPSTHLRKPIRCPIISNPAMKCFLSQATHSSCHYLFMRGLLIEIASLTSFWFPNSEALFWKSVTPVFWGKLSGRAAVAFVTLLGISYSWLFIE